MGEGATTMNFLYGDRRLLCRAEAADKRMPGSSTGTLKNSKP